MAVQLVREVKVTVNPREASKFVGVAHPETLTDMSVADDDRIMFLWEEAVRQANIRRVESLLRGDVAPEGVHEETLVSLGHQMAKRDLFKTMAYVS